MRISPTHPPEEGYDVAKCAFRAALSGTRTMIHRDRGVIVSRGSRIRTEPLEETIYRYRAINEWLEPILTRDELYFATPHDCNDPFDCRFDISLDNPVHGLEVFLREQRVVSQMMQIAGGFYESPFPAELAPSPQLAAMTDAELSAYANRIYEEFGLGNFAHQQMSRRTLEAARDRIGICCFAGRGDNLLMHAHYGAQHTGVCLEFQIRNHEGHRECIFEEPTLDFRDVLYQDRPPAALLYEMGTIESIHRVTLTKHTRWAYEEELRVVRLAGPGTVRYWRPALTGLIFGYRTSQQDVDLVLGWLGGRPGVTLSRAVPTPNGHLTTERL